jgi:hypothetical protein
MGGVRASLLVAPGQRKVLCDVAACRKARILPTGYFHVGFTLPAPLCALAMCNRERIYP